jgi:hypothetical protein
MKLQITRSDQAGKKYKAVFSNETTHKTIHFGASGYEDLTQHKDLERKKKYLARHRSSESWDNPQTAGSLSRWLLWDTTSFSKNVSNFKKRFNLK